MPKTAEKHPTTRAVSSPGRAPGSLAAAPGVHGWVVYGPYVECDAEPGDQVLVAESMTKADALLLVAAPDLLEALRRMVARFAPDDGGLSEPEIASADCARAAIAKATTP